MNTKINQANSDYQSQLEALFSDLEQYSDEVLNKKPQDGGWSAIQVMHHLILTEELGLRYVQKKLSYGTPSEKSSLTNRLRAFALNTYMRLPFKFSAPKIVSQENLPEQMSFAETKAQWLKIRTRWTEFLESMPPSLYDVPVFKHPIAGRITWVEMLEFHKAHLARHTKQIYRTI